MRAFYNIRITVEIILLTIIIAFVKIGRIIIYPIETSLKSFLSFDMVLKNKGFNIFTIKFKIN